MQFYIYVIFLGRPDDVPFGSAAQKSGEKGGREGGMREGKGEGGGKWEGTSARGQIDDGGKLPDIKG